MINRLGQRIKENFQETTRDLNLLAGGGGSSNNAYFDATEDKVAEISKLLESRIDSERLEGMKRIIAAMSKGRNMEGFFAQVVKNVVAPSIEIRKLVYIYLLRYAATNSDLLLLSINTFQKDLSDPSPLIRSMSLRVLTSIRVSVIQGLVMLGLKKLVNDRNPWVRKTVAGGLSKVYEMDSTLLPELLPLLTTLLGSTSPLTLGATLTAFEEICPDRLDLLHPYYRHIVRLLVDADEWGQAVILDVLTRYGRTMLEKPDGAGSVRPSEKNTTANGKESDDEFEGIDIDLAMLLDLAKPLFQSRNPAVVLATARMYYCLAPAGHASIGQQLIVAPLLRLAGCSGADRTGGKEIEILTWDVIAAMAAERPWLFENQHTSFFLHVTDSTAVQTAKLRAMVALVNAGNAIASVREFKHYVNLPNDAVAEAAIRAIGHCVRTQQSIAETGLRSLMRLLKSMRGSLVAQAVIVLKGVILQGVSLTAPERLAARLAKQLDNIANASARASVFWLVGQFAADDSADTTHGLKWDGIAPWVPDVLRKGVKGFTQEESPAKLQIITLAAKLLVLSPTTSKLANMAQYLFTLARYDADYDVRDRARFLSSLLRGVRDTAPIEEEGVTRDDEDEDIGGVTLRRDQARIVLLGQREVARVGGEDELDRAGLDVGSMSRVTRRKLGAYTPLPDWTDDPSDASLREEADSRRREPSPSPPTAISSASYAQPSSSAVPRNMGRSPLPSGSPAGSSPAGSFRQAAPQRAKFRDLDDFLNSDSESEDEEEEDEESFEVESADELQVDALSGPVRSSVQEYDENETEEEDDEDDETSEEDDSDEESEEDAPLYRP